MGATPDVYNNIARTRLLSLLQLTNPQGLVCVNLAITFSTEVGGIRASSQPITFPAVSMKQSTSLPVSESFPYAAYIGIDWADRKHDICLYNPITQQSEFSIIGSQPEAIDAWVEGLRKRFPQGTIAICTEQKRGPLIYALCKYEFLVIYPVNPQTVAKYRHAFAPSRAKADPTDAYILMELILRLRWTQSVRQLWSKAKL